MQGMSEVIAEVPVELACQALEKSIAQAWPRYGAVKVEYSMIEIYRLKTVISRIAPKRLQLASAVLAEITSNGTVPYLPVFYSDGGGSSRIGFGPLVEKNGDDLLLIDGVHRSLAASRCGIDYICAAVIQAELFPPPPGVKVDLFDIETVNTDVDRLPAFVGKGSAHFRPSARFTSAAEAALMQSWPTA
jgi:hypothetical protein